MHSNFNTLENGVSNTFVNSIEDIPIQTLYGFVPFGLDDLLSNIPLAGHTSLQQSVAGGDSLMWHPDTLSSAKRFLCTSLFEPHLSSNETRRLLHSFTYVLGNSDSDGIELLLPTTIKNTGSSSIDIRHLPVAFQEALQLGSSLLENKSAFQCFVNGNGEPICVTNSGKPFRKKRHRKKRHHHCDTIQPLKICLRGASGPTIVRSTSDLSRQTEDRLERRERRRKRKEKRKRKLMLQGCGPARHLEIHNTMFSAADNLPSAETASYNPQSFSPTIFPCDILPSSLSFFESLLGSYDILEPPAFDESTSPSPLPAVRDLVPSDEESANHTGNLLSAITSSRGGMEFGLGRGKPDCFEEQNSSRRRSKRPEASESCNRRSGIVKRRRDELASLTSWDVSYDKGSRAQEQTEESESDEPSAKEDSSANGANLRPQRLKKGQGVLRNDFVYEGFGKVKKDSVTASCPAPLEAPSTKRSCRRVNTIYVQEDSSGDSSDGDEPQFSRRKNKKKSRAYEDSDDEFVVHCKESSYTQLLKMHVDRPKTRRVRVSLIPEGGLCHLAFPVEDDSSRMEEIVLKTKDDIKKLLKESWTVQKMHTELSRLQSQIQRLYEPGTSHDAGKEPIVMDEQLRVPDSVLTALLHAISELKALGATKCVGTEELKSLLTLLHLNIIQGGHLHFTEDNGQKLLPNTKKRKRSADDEQQLILHSVDAALLSLLILANPAMPKQLFVEDAMDHIVAVLRTQLTYNIFPLIGTKTVVSEESEFGKSSRGKSVEAINEEDLSKSAFYHQLYQRLVDIVLSLAQLVTLQPLTETLLMRLLDIATGALCADNLVQLQLATVQLLTNIFARYDNFKQNILDNLLDSLHKLPSGKRSSQTFRLNSQEGVQMFTGLVLILVQTMVKVDKVNNTASLTKTCLRTSLSRKKVHTKKGGEPLATINKEQQQPVNENDEPTVNTETSSTSYSQAMQTTFNFLLPFLKKCTEKHEEHDLRTVFESFVRDLLLAVNRPEWPAAEMVLSLLGGVLVSHFNNKSMEQTTRVACVEYLGIIASTLRRDVVASPLKESDINAILQAVDSTNSTVSTPEKVSSDDIEGSATSPNRMEKLFDLLIHFLSQSDDSRCKAARNVYLAQWLGDCSKELRTLSSSASNSTANSKASKVTRNLLQLRQQHIAHLMQQDTVELFSTLFRRGLEYEEACLVCRYLASKRPLAQSFDLYVTQICKLLSENSVAVRTKAMRCLSMVVEADPNVLARNDVEKSVHSRFLDASISVREAAVELVGKFCLDQTALLAQYYPMLAKRILDTGTSVRRRVIKIFRDICLQYPDFEKNTDICLKLICRVNDEEGVRKLVFEVFHNLWFTPVRERDSLKLLQKVMSITDVVASSTDISVDWFFHFLESVLKDTNEKTSQTVEKACKQIVDCLVQNISRLEEVSNTSNTRLLACLATLCAFTRARPQWMASHASGLEPYLRTRCSEDFDHHVIHYALRILETTLPLWEAPEEAFLVRVEKTLFELILRQGKLVLESATACLSALVTHWTHNMLAVRNFFIKQYDMLTTSRQRIAASLDKFVSPTHKPLIMRALFIVGMFCKHFGTDHIKGDSQGQESLFGTLLFFTTEVDDADVRLKALNSLGFLCVGKVELLCSRRMKDFYQAILADSRQSTARDKEQTNDQSVSPQNTNRSTVLGFLKPDVDVQVLVLEGLAAFLSEDEKKLMTAESQWQERRHQESLKETDPKCTAASQVAQFYYPLVVECCFHLSAVVRRAALSFLVAVLKQGLINPVPVVATLIALQTEDDAIVRNGAQTQLEQIHSKYPFFVSMRAAEGVLASYRLQRSVHEGQSADVSTSLVRGMREPQPNSSDTPSAVNQALYSLLRNSRPLRHALIGNLLRKFEDPRHLLTRPIAVTEPTHHEEDDIDQDLCEEPCTASPVANTISSGCTSQSSLGELLFVADNLAHFPFQVMEEPLYVLHHIDLIVSLTGHHILKTVSDSLFSDLLEHHHQTCLEAGVDPNTKTLLITDEEVNENVMMQRIGFSASETNEDTSDEKVKLVTERRKFLQECVSSSRSCFLLLQVKQYLKDLYGISDMKAQDFVPNQNVKLWDKPLIRKPNVRYNVEPIVEILTKMEARQCGQLQSQSTEEEYRGLVQEYLSFRTAMLTMEPEEHASLHTSQKLIPPITVPEQATVSNEVAETAKTTPKGRQGNKGKRKSPQQQEETSPVNLKPSNKKAGSNPRNKPAPPAPQSVSQRPKRVIKKRVHYSSDSNSD